MDIEIIKRYQNEGKFYQLVQTMCGHMSQNPDFSPKDIMDATVLAEHILAKKDKSNET